MKKFPHLIKLYSVSLIFSLSLIGCTSSDLQVSEFKFKYNEEDYLIRSAYCPNDPSSCNQLIGNNFIAVDMNQDRIIDNIKKGDITLAEAQSIYDYALGLLKQQNRLNEVPRSQKKYTVKGNFINYEITTFNPEIGRVFNEFIIIDKNNAAGFFQISIFIDQNADGKIDERLKGTISLNDAQIKYDNVIERGISSNDLIRDGNFIIVK